MYLYLFQWYGFYLWFKLVFVDLFEMNNIHIQFNQVTAEFFMVDQVHLVQEMKSYDDKLWEKIITIFE